MVCNVIGLGTFLIKKCLWFDEDNYVDFPTASEYNTLHTFHIT